MNLTTIAQESGEGRMLLTVPSRHFPKSQHITSMINCMISIAVSAGEPKAILENMCDETDTTEIPLSTLEQLLLDDIDNYQLMVL